MFRTAFLAALFAAATSPAAAVPVQWEAASGGNDHWYDYVWSWVPHETAQALAASSVFNGMTGYLVTLTSQAEQDFVDSLAFTSYQIGGGQNADGEWVWLNGPEAGELIGASGWDNFQPGQPDASSFWADYLMSPSWSTEWWTTNGFVASYVIEYSAPPAVPLPASVLLLGACMGGLVLAGRRKLGLSAAA